MKDRFEIFVAFVGLIVSIIVFVWFYRVMNHMDKMLTEINSKIPKASISVPSGSHFKVDSSGVRWVPN
jgi:hypothetical protein